MGKGGEYERKMAKTLSRWWTNGERDDIFWRSQQSGGRATIRARRGKGTANQQGDLQAMDICGQPLIDKVCIELKKGYASFGVDAVLLGKAEETVLERFIIQCRRESGGRDWWLIVKRDFKNDVICFPLTFIPFLRAGGVYEELCAMPHVSVSFKEYRVQIYRLDDFLRVVKPEVFE